MAITVLLVLTLGGVAFGISFIANKKKPIILSTGASNKKEIASALSILKKNGAKDICLMHCVLNYPTSDLDANLNMITDLKNTFKNHRNGLS